MKTGNPPAVESGVFNSGWN